MVLAICLLGICWSLVFFGQGGRIVAGQRRRVTGFHPPARRPPGPLSTPTLPVHLQLTRPARHTCRSRALAMHPPGPLSTLTLPDHLPPMSVTRTRHAPVRACGWLRRCAPGPVPAPYLPTPYLLVSCACADHPLPTPYLFHVLPCCRTIPHTDPRPARPFRSIYTFSSTCSSSPAPTLLPDHPASKPASVR